MASSSDTFATSSVASPASSAEPARLNSDLFILSGGSSPAEPGPVPEQAGHALSPLRPSPSAPPRTFDGGTPPTARPPTSGGLVLDHDASDSDGFVVDGRLARREYTEREVGSPTAAPRAEAADREPSAGFHAPSFLDKLEERWDRWAQGQWCPDWCCEGPCIVITLAGACVLGLIFMVVMLAISNVPVERYNYALKFNTLDKVDLSKTYENGLYWWGPSYDAVRFSSLWERECFRGADALEVFVSSGQTMRVTACFHYKLNKTTVPTLFQQVGNAYSDPIRVTVQSAFKNAATTIPFQDYITNRRSVADTLHRTAQDAVVAAGLPVEVPRAGMLLRSVALPSTVVQQNLDVFEHKELRLQQSYAEQAASVRLDTQLNVTATLAAASAIERKAMVEAEQQRATARNSQEAALQRAMGAALSAMAGKLNVTTAADVAELGRYNGLLDAMTEAGRRFTLLVPQQPVTPFL